MDSMFPPVFVGTSQAAAEQLAEPIIAALLSLPFSQINFACGVGELSSGTIFTMTGNLERSAGWKALRLGSRATVTFRTPKVFATQPSIAPTLSVEPVMIRAESKFRPCQRIA